jgi:hypothetical protein
MEREGKSKIQEPKSKWRGEEKSKNPNGRQKFKITKSQKA